MTAAQTLPVNEAKDSSSATGKRSLVQAAGWVGILFVIGAWTKPTLDALAIRRVISDYEDLHGPARLGLQGQWTTHFKTFHDDLMAVGADYFYPFGNALFAALAIPWIIAVVAATAKGSRLRLAMLGIGLAALFLTVILLSSTLSTYVLVTD